MPDDAATISRRCNTTVGWGRSDPLALRSGKLGQSGCRQAFTLLELIFTMLLLATILAITVPNLRGFRDASTARDAADELLSVIQYARNRAAVDARIYRLNFDQSSYWLTMQQGQELVPVTTTIGRPKALDRLEVEIRRQDAAAGTFIDFYPDTRCDPATIRLIAVDGTSTTLASLSPAEPYRKLTAEEAARS